MTLKTEIAIRELTPADSHFQKEMTYIALWDPPGSSRRPRSVLEHPKVRAYYEDWGRPGDLGLVARREDEAVGLIQTRIKACVTNRFQDFPELGIGILPGFQGQGIGSLLFRELLPRLKGKVNGLRLGVHPQNAPAIALYTKFGFRFYEHPEGQYPQYVLEF